MGVQWDVAVVGGGPAGLMAALTAARAGARTIVVEKAAHPRYKTCGGGLIGVSVSQLAGRIAVPARDRVHRVTVTHDGRRAFTRGHRSAPLVTMVDRAELDQALARAAVAAGARLDERVTVRAVEQGPDEVRLRLADGSRLTARVVVGADGSAGVTAGHVGVHHTQVDLGLEVELPVPAAVAQRWRHRLLLDWGPLPGSYGWVFPKGDRLTVGVIAGRGQGAATRGYLRALVTRLGLDQIAAEQDSGHLTRCRSDDSPLRRGRVLVAGDAAGLLEPLTREGISFALRSGALAGAAAAGGDPARYEAAVRRTLTPEMQAGRRLLAGFTRRPGVVHATLATPLGWRAFVRFCRGQSTLDAELGRPVPRAMLAVLG